MLHCNGVTCTCSVVHVCIVVIAVGYEYGNAHTCSIRYTGMFLLLLQVVGCVVRTTYMCVWYASVYVYQCVCVCLCACRYV